MTFVINSCGIEDRLRSPSNVGLWQTGPVSARLGEWLESQARLSGVLCVVCYKCNGYKGSNIAALDPATGEATKLHNPRQQEWDEHFRINPDAALTGLTPEGRTTIAVCASTIRRVSYPGGSP